MSAIRAIISRTNPLGTTLLLYGDDLIDDNNELVSAVELPADVFEHLLAFSRGNQEIRAVINYSDDSSIKIYDYADTIVTDEDGVQGIILEDTGIILYSGTQPTIGEDILPFIVTGGGGGGSDLPDVTSADNGNVLTVVNGAWDKASAPTELPAVTSTDNGKALVVSSGAWTKGSPLPSVSSSDNGKVLTVVSGKWQKQTPASSGGMSVLKLEVQDWGIELVLAIYNGSTFESNNFDTYDAIEIHWNGIHSSFDFTRNILGNRYSDGSVEFYNANSSADSIVIDALSGASTFTFGGWEFTYSNGHWSCPVQPE